MTYTYAWTDAEQTSLKRTDENGNVAFVPTDPANRDYAAFLAGPQTADAYVAPPAPPAPSTEEKVNNLLSAYGLSREELKAALNTDEVATADS